MDANEKVLNETTPVNLDNEEEDDGFDKPFKSVESIKLPIKESDLPIIIRQEVAAAPANRKVPIFISCLSPLGAIATRVRLRYPYDLQPHAILLQTIIEAPPSTGKRCFSQVVNDIISPTLGVLDEDQRRIEQEYREKKSARTQNEKIGEAPKTTVRCIPPATSKTIIVKRSDLFKRVLGDYLTLWMWAEELAQLGDAGKSGFSNLRTVLRTAYDLDSKFGQDFASENSYSANADVNICTMFCSTPQDVDEVYNKREIMGGGCSRVILVSLEDEAGSKPPHFEEKSEADMALINKALDLMMDDVYDSDGNLMPLMFLDTSWLNSSIDRFTNRACKKVKDLMIAGDPGYLSTDVFRKRASVNGFRGIGGVIYYMYLIENRLAEMNVEGAIWRSEDNIRRLCTKSFYFLAVYCLNSNNQRWGKTYEECYLKQKEGAKIDQRKPLIDQLPKTFTREDISKMEESIGLQTDPRVFISNWKAKGWIKKIRKNLYEKTV